MMQLASVSPNEPMMQLAPVSPNEPKIQLSPVSPDEQARNVQDSILDYYTIKMDADSEALPTISGVEHNSQTGAY